MGNLLWVFALAQQHSSSPSYRTTHEVSLVHGCTDTRVWTEFSSTPYTAPFSLPGIQDSIHSLSGRGFPLDTQSVISLPHPAQRDYGISLARICVESFGAVREVGSGCAIMPVELRAVLDSNAALL